MKDAEAHLRYHTDRGDSLENAKQREEGKEDVDLIELLRSKSDLEEAMEL